MTQQLSPVAQAVQFAAFRVYDEEEHLYVVSAEKHAGMIAAAALRAAADQVVPPEQERLFNEERPWDVELGGVIYVREQLLTIANELEAH